MAIIVYILMVVFPIIAGVWFVIYAFCGNDAHADVKGILIGLGCCLFAVVGYFVARRMRNRILG